MFIDIAYASEVAKATADEGVLASLGIHGVQFLEQLFSFALVSVILWFLILKPLTKKMAERQKMIEDSVDNVKKIEANLGMSEKKYQEKIDQAKVDANKIIEKASTEALAVAEVAKEKTRKEIELLVEDARKNIKTERTESIAEIKQQVASLVVEAAEKILAGKINIEKDNKIVEETIKSLK
jgi:F-type H+-transporting ATPase subunit b